MARTILGEYANSIHDLIGDRVIQQTRTTYGVQVYGLIEVLIPIPTLTAIQIDDKIRLEWEVGE